MGELIKYNAACLAIKEAKAVDEVKDIRDKSQALAHYARISKNKDLELDAAEIRIRAERRLGEIMAQQRAEDGRASPGKPSKRVIEKPITPQVADPPVTLAAQGIDKNLADRARKLAAVAESDFEATLDEHREEQKAVTARTFAKLEKAASDAPNTVWRAWVEASEAEQVEFLDMAGLQKLPDLSDGPVDAQAWAEFVTHRANIRKPLNRQSAQKNYAVLAQLTAAQQRESVDKTIANRWTGVFAPKEGLNGQHSGLNKPVTEQDRIAAANPIESDPNKGHLF